MAAVVRAEALVPSESVARYTHIRMVKRSDDYSELR